MAMTDNLNVRNGTSPDCLVSVRTGNKLPFGPLSHRDLGQDFVHEQLAIDRKIRVLTVAIPIPGSRRPSIRGSVTVGKIVRCRGCRPLHLN